MEILKANKFIKEKLDIKPVSKERLDNIQDEIERRMISDKDVDRIQKTLDDNNVKSSVYLETEQDQKFVCVRIEGDTKTDHEFSKKLINELGYKLCNSKLLIRDFTDWYTELYYYNK